MGKRVDLTGTKQGKLTIIKPLPPRNGKYYWLCECECGNVKEIRYSSLKRGQQSCGCMRGSNFKGIPGHDESHIGERYGLLTIMEFAGTTKGNEDGQGKEAIWKCKCDCGNETYKTMRALKKSANVSCGCFIKNNGHKEFKFDIGEIINTNYSTLKIVSRFRKKKKNSNSHEKYYECECMNCHEKTVILENVLVRKSGSCRACSRARSFPEKLVYWVLKDAGVDFITEYSPEWSGRMRYDYYFEKDGNQYVIEADGLDHFNPKTRNKKTLEDIQDADRLKDTAAQEHGIKVIRLDCRYSNSEYIKTSVNNSELPELIPIENVDWDKCIKRARGLII